MTVKAPHWPLNGSVLVIDDDKLFLAAARRKFRKAGATCHAAATHAQALHLLRKTPEIALVILDWDMPEEDPSTLVSRIRECRPDLQIIGNSGDAKRWVDFTSLGIDDFLDKPWSINKLIDVLSK